MGGHAAAHPADLRVVYLRGGNHTVKTLAMLVLPPGFLPAVSLRLGELTVGPARDQKSHTQFPELSRIASSSESLNSSPWVCAMNMFLVLCC